MIIALLLRISDNARRPVEEFHTGVLTITEDPQPVPAGAPAEDAAASALTVDEDAPTTNLPSAGARPSGEAPTDFDQRPTGGER